ncbi:hypothetical protein V8C86DRAFT_2937439 [Haematococcus lacustris]|nr:hypothetical protein QJQ45_015970 [Haematococcus lacustris]
MASLPALLQAGRALIASPMTSCPALSQATQRFLRTSAVSQLPAEVAPAGRHLMSTEPFLTSESHRPRLGTWPNLEPGVDKPGQAAAPQPHREMLETKNVLVADYSDADEIAEYDRVKGKEIHGGQQ